MESKIKFTGDFEKVGEEERQFINDKLAKFSEKNDPFFTEMHLKLDCHESKEKSRGRSAFVCKLNLVSDGGRFSAEEKDFGAEKTISQALDKIERQIKKKH